MLLSVLGMPNLAVAQSAELKQAYQQYKTARGLRNYPDAERFARKGLELTEIEFGQENIRYAWRLVNLASVFKIQGKIQSALPLFTKALRLAENDIGPNHVTLANFLSWAGSAELSMGRYVQAETHYKRALRIIEKVVGENDRRAALLLTNLAELFWRSGRLSDGVKMLKRAITIHKYMISPDLPALGLSLNKLGRLYNAQGRYGDAKKLIREALDIRKKAFGSEHPAVARSMSSLASVHRHQGNYTQSETLYKKSLAIKRKSHGSNHLQLAGTIGDLAIVYAMQGRSREAERLFQRSLTNYQANLRPDHPDIGRTFINLSEVYSELRDQTRALEYARLATNIFRKRALRADIASSVIPSNERKEVSHYFSRHIYATYELSSGKDADRNGLIAEGFEAGQLAYASGAGSAVSRMAARFATGDNSLAAMIRERQDGGKRWQKIEAALVEATRTPPDRRNRVKEEIMREISASLGKRMADMDAKLTAQFPRYAELSATRPLPLTEAQALLKRHEALVTYHVWEKQVFAFALRRDQAIIRKIDMPVDGLNRMVMAVRGALNLSGVRTVGDIKPFDTTRAFKLYQKLFRPVETALKGATHVFVVPDGALQSLPFGALVMKKPAGRVTEFIGYRQVEWLAKKYAFTTLPSVSSLRALRKFARRSRATKPFLGVGDPQLDGGPKPDKSLNIASLFSPRGIAIVDTVRRIASLPDTAVELRSLARSLGAGEEALILGADATEARIKSTDLSDHRIIAFATHGLVAGEFKGLSEPALVLTPPANSSAQDDGLLTASEVAGLKLDADWVILSACNTAAADGTPGAEGLSGLARAFIYAGSRSLLVSHWLVASDAAVRLTTRMIRESRKPGVGRSESLRRAMLALMNDPDNPHYAHPVFWAPFVVVGEGGLPL